ncbi:MAG: universal stress protein [Chloroflexi bacterium]|nr:universal stress protein [Chloroflexota bacterium]MBI4505485.1 universal stress protein [Chloroflexota bacterium]
MYQHVLVPLDGSATAEAAMPHAEALARQGGARLTLLRVLPPPDSYVIPEAVFVDREQVMRSLEAEALGYLRAVRERLEGGGLTVRTTTRVGDAATAILDTARAVGADLIVMATHGRSGLGRWALGSVADRVVRAAGVPVLLVRPSEPPPG